MAYQHPPGTVWNLSPRKHQSSRMLLLAAYAALTLASVLSPAAGVAAANTTDSDTTTELDTALRKGCATILESAVYRIMYEDAGIMYPEAMYAAFIAAVCGLPYNLEFQELGDLSPDSAQQDFDRAAKVLVTPLEYRRFQAAGGLAMGPQQLSMSNSWKVVRDFHAAVCLGLPVQQTLNVVAISGNSLNMFSTIRDLDTVMEAYSSEERGCLQAVERNGISYTRVSEIGELPLIFELVYTPPKTDRAAAVTNKFVPADAPCTIQDTFGFPVPTENAPIEPGKRYTVTCDLPSDMRNDDQVTAVTLAINLQGAFLTGDKRYYMMMFNGRVPFSPPPFPNPPPSPSPSPPVPPSPRPPSPPTPPPPSCGALLPPQCRSVLTNSVLDNLGNLTSLAKVVGAMEERLAVLEKLVEQQAAIITQQAASMQQQQQQQSIQAQEVMVNGRVCIGTVCLSSFGDETLTVLSKEGGNQGQIDVYRVCYGADACVEAGPGYGSLSVVGKPGSDLQGNTAATLNVYRALDWEGNPFEVYHSRDAQPPMFYVHSTETIENSITSAPSFGSDAEA